MIDWIKTAQGVVAIAAAIFSTLVAWWCLGLPRLVFSPEQTSNTQPIDLNSAALSIGAASLIPSTATSTRSASPTSSAPTAGSRPPGTT
jgi:hypothetical protein